MSCSGSPRNVDMLVGEDNFYLISRRKDGQLVTREDTRGGEAG